MGSNVDVPKLLFDPECKFKVEGLRIGLSKSDTISKTLSISYEISWFN